jgi:hypothetical protein
MAWPHLIEPVDLMGPDASKEALATTARGNNIARLLGTPLHRRGELMALLETIPAVEPSTPHMGGLWRWSVVLKALREKAPHLIPEQYR